MSDKPKKKNVNVYTISETIYVSYQVIATSEKDAREAYLNLPNDKWHDLVSEAVSNNYQDEEVVNDEEYTGDGTDPDDHPITDKAKKAIFHNNSINE
jgi:hypothetical protein